VSCRRLPSGAASVIINANRRSIMGQSFTIENGQRFQEAGQGYLGKPMSVWTVEDVFTTTDSLICARLVCGADHSMRKTLSVAILADPRRFIRLNQ
jgi:hypothetical protein